MKIYSDDEILDQKVRKQIISELNSDENKYRKREAFKRYEIYKDKTDKYVLEQLEKQFDKSTIDEMAYSIANISLAKKVISKLARVYSNGVRREIEDDKAATDQLETVVKKLSINTELKKTNAYLKLQRNLALYIKPCPTDNGYKLTLEPLQPYLYDVIPDAYEPTKPKVFILSDYNPSTTFYTTGDAATVGRTTAGPINVSQPNDGTNQEIADPDDELKGEIIWWTKNYHFTTDLSGNIISQEIDNPIKHIPAVFFAIEQDGSFWAEGGDDLIDGTVLINAVLTHNQHIAVTQGYGQFYMKGKNLPRNVKIGPNKAVIMEYEEGEPEPSIGFANASPDLAGLKSLVEQYIALLLSTNNLSTSSVMAELGAQSSPSGIAMIIDKAESMEDVQDQRQLFLDKEPELFEIISKWIEVFGDSMIEELKGIKIPHEEMQITFNETQAITSEAEKLDNIKKRKDLGINTLEELIQIDNPSLTKKQIKKKIMELLNYEGSKNGSKRSENSVSPRSNGGTEGYIEQEGSDESDRGASSGADSSVSSGLEESD